MATVSLCMIVKNESRHLARCLDSVSGLMDEIIIVDTGSDDDTVEIARQYTDRIYDFEWRDDFSAARNYAFSLCSCDYIYSCDADEFLDEEARRQFRLLMEAIDPAVELVQMKYYEPHRSSVLNSRMEYRPKLFKRLRTFTWINPVHETIRTDPVVFDSEIVITHLPDEIHSSRDFGIFEKAVSGGYFSEAFISMYVRELFKCGTGPDIHRACTLIREALPQAHISDELLLDILCLFVRDARLQGDTGEFVSCLTQFPAAEGCSEIQYEIGLYLSEMAMYDDAIFHFEAATIAQSRIDIHTGGDLPLSGIIEALEARLAAEASEDTAPAIREQINKYREALQNWSLPEE